MNTLKEYINSKITIEEAVLDTILSAFTIKEYDNDQTIIKNGQYVTNYYFIVSGGIRIVIDTPDKDITAWLLFENNFFSDLESIKSGQPSKAKMLAVGKSMILSIEVKKMHKFYEQYPEWQEFGRKMMEELCLNLIDTLISFQIMDAETRYLHLLQKSDILNRVPLKQLASYLGITPTSLSRIRKNIR
ncbi:Crp/Fnr family transcriptional regulator [Aquimarina muelleri]|uniref:Cyclic nucleotide-binding protein n=1 Tax=Aquimarina muelleri TaxID=279356 RepID=A0A918JXV1_9FLAO|nr:Crp/Fnr family transcriptional regulator [Aquimarina muelleri]MCX2763826.1 Crp/Fnr family transcriptional regulator [Aquimarina muelleri]GGX29436.1 cyclic nucleotide-binding protein [Aquimarina muelleri]